MNATTLGLALDVLMPRLGKLGTFRMRFGWPSQAFGYDPSLAPVLIPSRMATGRDTRLVKGCDYQLHLDKELSQFLPQEWPRLPQANRHRPYKRSSVSAWKNGVTIMALHTVGTMQKTGARRIVVAQ
jgi:hypothetical protein